MIKFVLQHCNAYCEYVTQDFTDECPLEGAVLEQWVEEESQKIPAQFHYFEEARLDENGFPFIYKEKKFTPYEEYGHWKRIGFDHSIEKFEPEGKDPYWIYTRKTDQSAWTFAVETLEQMEMLLDKEYEMGVLYTPINGIRYYLVI